MRSLYGFLISIIMFGVCVHGWGVRVYAQEDSSLSVGIRSYSGEEIAVRSGSLLITCLPVTFDLPEGGRNSYSISVDDGTSFGAFVSMDTPNLTLFPEDKTSPSGRWQIRFRKESDDGRQAVSDTYKVCFDCKEPRIEFANPEVVSGWIQNGQNVNFKFSDENGISRVISRCGDDVLFEEHIKGEDVKKDVDISFDVKDGGAGENTVEVTCFDMAGNSSVLSFTYMLDVASPEISADGIADGEELSSGATLTIDARDAESDPFIEYVTERDTGEEIIRTQGTNESGSLMLDFTDSGRYRVSAVAVDRSGRRSEEIRREFVIDTIAPSVTLGGLFENADLRTEARVTIDACDNLYEGTQVDITMTRTTPEETENIPIESYKLMACHDSREVNISTDGEYELHVAVTDRAGNRAETSGKFRVDSTAPSVAITGLAEGEVTKEKPVLRFSAGELFYDSTIMTAVLEKLGKDGYVPVETVNHVMRSVRDHVDVSVSEEGQYRLTCRASDRSGNMSSSSAEFTVDHTPPVISGIKDMEGGFFSAFSLPSKLMSLISDANPVTADAYINDTHMEDDAVIIEEGKYVLTVIAEDAAGNAAEETAAFIVDHTSPQIVLEGFDREGNIKKGSVVKVKLLEDTDKLISVSFCGKDVAIDKEKEACIEVGEYGEYDLAVKAQDPAGNVTDTLIHTSCYATGPGYLLTEKRLSSRIKGAEKSDIDMKGIVIGLVTVLAGTFGLTYREYLRD